MLKPHRVEGTPEKEVTLTGTLFPWDGDQPHYLMMPGSDYRYLPCFTSADKLREVMDRVGVSNYTIKQVEDGPDFLTSFDVLEAANVRVILDPYFVAGGRVRFTQVAPNVS